MKSLLVDALRQANTGDTTQSLSDSGSFDTENTDFGNTANDEVADRPGSDEEELELLTSTGMLIVADDGAVECVKTSGSLALMDGPGPRQPDVREYIEYRTAPKRAPKLVRYTPLLCLLLAAAAAGSWFLYQQIEDRYFRAEIASARKQPHMGGGNKAETRNIEGSSVGRFAFIDIPINESDRDAENTGATP